MANIKKSAEELIGRTPLMELVNYEKAAGVTDAVILAKLEYFNPLGSSKGVAHEDQRGGGPGGHHPEEHPLL